MSDKFDKVYKYADGSTSIFIAGEDDELKKAMNKQYSVQMTPALPKSEQEKLIYSLLEQYIDFIFCQRIEKYSFYSKEQFNIFAKDNSGGLYGFIGGAGDLLDDNYPIGYVSSEGKSGKIANNFKDLLSLVIYYPFWLDLLQYHNNDIKRAAEVFEKERLKEIPDYCEVKQTLVDNLRLNSHEYSIESLFNCLSDEPKFIVYSVDGDNHSENLFT
jgi:hypothetical protein